MKISKSSRILLLSSIIAIGLGVFVVILLWLLKNTPKNKAAENSSSSDLGCVSSIEEKIVRGDSLTGVIEDGQTVRILLNHYSCHEIERNDLVLYKYSGNKNPLIKIAKGLPGDRFELKDTSSGSNLYINNELLKNSEGEPYVLDSRSKKMLSLYANDYKNIIPKDTYLLLGNQTNGSLDSTRFGLVSKDDILGKAEVIDF
jgi:signal peptidase I